MQDEFFNCADWRSMLDRETLPVSDVSIGLLRREDFASRQGTLLLCRHDGQAHRVDLREYRGETGDDVALLFVAEAQALTALCSSGWSSLPAMIRRGSISTFILKTMIELEAAGLAEFIEDLELAEPKH